MCGGGGTQRELGGEGSDGRAAVWGQAGARVGEPDGRRLPGDGVTGDGSDAAGGAWASEPAAI